MYPDLLATRGLFHHSNTSTSGNHSCPIEITAGPEIVAFVGSLTFHEFATILSGACAIASTILIAIPIALHAINYSNPVQQRQIIRIILLIPWVSLFAFLIVWRDDIGDYLVESLDFGCSIALSAFLLLMCDFVLSHREGFDDLFGQGAFSRGAIKGASPPWLRSIWYGVLQFLPTSLIIWVATAVSLATGIYCKGSNSIHHASIWITIFKFVVTTVAIISCLRFYGKNKPRLLQHKILLKLFAFKSIIGLSALQTFVISILGSHGVLKPTKYMTYHDVNTGLASLILAVEMPIFSILLILAFPVSPYKDNGPAASPLSAIVDAFNITDMLSAFVRGPMRLVREQQRQILRQESMKVDMGERPAHGGYEQFDMEGRARNF